VDLPEELIALLHQPSPCFVATLMPDGSPQMTQTWVDTDGEHVIINTVQGFRKPWTVLMMTLTTRPFRYFEIRGRVVKVTAEGGAEHIEALAQRYLGAPYPWYGGRDQVRVIVTISADKINRVG
jgi:leucyl-tRNA synthetase